MNFLKSLLPDLFILVSIPIEMLGKAISYISAILVAIGIRLHIILNTKRGIKLREIENRLKEAINQITKNNKLQTATEAENARLAKAFKTTQVVEQPDNVINLGRKKDEPTDSKS